MTRVIYTVLFLIMIQPIYAKNIDQDYGRNIHWWTASYDQFMSYFGVERSYALVIGVGHYDNNSYSNLPSENDAIKVKNFLINQAGFDNVRVVTGDKVTRERIFSLMSNYSRILTKKDRFLFYWSGHGVTGGQARRKQGYLAVKTSTVNPATMLSMSKISTWDNNFKAKQTLYLIDACFSGIAASKAMSIRQEQTIKRISRPSRQILTAGLENQETIVIEQIGGGVFTRALLDGLEGRADTDKGFFKKDGIVTARELEAYVRERVNKERLRVHWKSPITPVLYNFSHFEGDFYFVSDKRKLTTGSLVFDRHPVDKGTIATGVRLQPKPKRYGKNGRFHDNGDGTILDAKTKLMWKKCSEGQFGNNCLRGGGVKYNWNFAFKHYRQISFAGYNDWRLPTTKELTTIIECADDAISRQPEPTLVGCMTTGVYSYHKPTIRLSFFPNTLKNIYWTSTPYNSLSGKSKWNMTFDRGGVYTPYREPNIKGYVRLVRKQN